jgi:catechol 2,3-dioxygenase-like lactoylglutathione lyase family enzyme
VTAAPPRVHDPGVSIQLDHTIVPARDGEAAARWFADLLGLPTPVHAGHFWQVATANGVDLDFDTYGDDGTFTAQHYAFRVGADDFEAILGRIRGGAIDHWADPGLRHPGEIYHHGGDRGVYFLNGDGHLLEVLTREGVDDVTGALAAPI